MRIKWAVIPIVLLLMIVPWQSASAQAQVDAPPPLAAGGRYVLLQITATRPAAVEGASVPSAAPAATAAGGSYVLLLPAEVLGTGTPCCCMHLPCIKK